MPKKTTPAEQAARQSQIVSGARSSFAARGYHGTTIEDLERACKLSRATLFRYFASKAQILEAVVSTEKSRLEQEFAQIVGEARERQDLHRMVQDAFMLQIARSESDPDALKLRLELVTLGRHDRTIAKRVALMEQAQRRWRKALVVKLLKSHWVHAGWTADAATDVASTMALGLATQISFGLPLTIDRTNLALAMTDALFHLLSNPPRKSKRA